MNAGLSAAILILASGAPLFAVDPERNFAGQWVLDKTASNRQQPVLAGERLSVTQDELRLRCASPTEQGPASQWSYLLDGTETRSSIGDETRNSVVKWEGSALLINTLVSGPRDYTVMDRWQLSRDHSTLTITRQVAERAKTSEDVLVYRREGQLSVRESPAKASPAPTQADSRDPFGTPEALDAALNGHSGSSDIVVRAGTRVGLSLRNAVDSKHSHDGDHVYLQTIAPITVNNVIAIPVGSYVNGTITESNPAHGVKGKGQLFVRFDSLTLPNGVTRDFRSRLGSADSSVQGKVDSKEGKITGQRDGSGDARTVSLGTGIGGSVGGIAGAAAGHPLGGVGIGAAAGAAAGLATIFHGKRPEAVLPAGSTLEMVLDRDLRFSPAELLF
jgi:type IV secretion system protein VirB10